MNLLIDNLIKNWTYFTFEKGGIIMATLVALIVAIVVFKVVLNALNK